MHNIARIFLILMLAGTAAQAAELPDTTSFRHLRRAKSIGCEDCHGVAKPTEAAKTEICGDCHGDIEDAYKPRTLVHCNREIVLNVHNSHYGDIECLSCHKIHSKGQLMCNECHSWDIEVK